MKFVLFVEGDVERLVVPSFLKKWLDPQLTNPVGMRTVCFNGWGDYVREIARKVELHLQKPDAVAGIGLLDLQGPTFYPTDRTGAEARCTWGKTHLEKMVGHPRFRQHFAVHELEAWLLAEPAYLPSEVRRALPPSASAAPETVNFDEPPAKLLKRLYSEKLRQFYKKTTDSTNLFRNLDPEICARKCPQLRAMLDDMLALAKAAGL